MKLSQNYLLSVFLILSFHILLGQENNQDKPKPALKLADKAYMGANIGLQFGNTTLIDLSPLFAYRITPQFSIGPGLTYLHLKDRRNNYIINVYGARLFSRLFVNNTLFIHGEYEILNGPFDPFFNIRINVTNFLAGAGYKQQLGEKSYLTMTVLYCFNNSVYSPYINPVTRAGFVVEF